MPFLFRRLLTPRFNAATALGCSGIALFFTVWIVLPPLHAVLWIVQIIAGEWGLWLGALGFLGAVLGWVSHRRVGKVAAVLGLAAFLLSLVPLAFAVPVARENQVTLSLPRYLLGEPGLPAITPETVQYKGVGGIKHAVDVYQPLKRPALPGPAVIVVHGGSWRGGKRSDFPQWDRWLASQGYTVFDIDYTTAPQPNARGALADVRAAVLFVWMNADKWNIAPNRVVLLGRSAGGHLALLAAYTPGVSERIQGVISLYGPTDLPWGYDNTATFDVIDGKNVLRKFLGGDPRELPDEYRFNSPVSRVNASTPPTLLLHGGRDTLVGPQHMERLAARLKTTGIHYKTVLLPWATHGFDAHLTGWGGQIAQKTILDFLRAHIGE